MTDSAALDDFFARCEDVLTDWRGSVDAMDTADKRSHWLLDDSPSQLLGRVTAQWIPESAPLTAEATIPSMYSIAVRLEPASSVAASHGEALS